MWELQMKRKTWERNKAGSYVSADKFTGLRE
jgi:hypothetical protein